MSSIWSAALATAPLFSKYTMSPEYLFTSGYAVDTALLDARLPKELPNEPLEVPL